MMRVSTAIVVSMLAILTSIGSGASAQEKTEDEEKKLGECKSMYQGIFLGQTHRSSIASYTNYDDTKIRVCGASPACDTCVDMYPGDCRYVFPTGVTVYSEKKGGVEQICACQVLGCNLPWDPLGWGRKCATKLGCFTKPSSAFGTAEFPESLCSGRNDGRRIKFGPLSFAYQTYARPGVAVLIYEGKTLKERKHLLAPDVESFNVSRDSHGADGLREAVEEFKSTSSLQSVKFGNLGSDTDDVLRNGVVNEKKGFNAFRIGQETHNVRLYRKKGMVCVQYYGIGGAERRAVPVIHECYPAPEPRVPILYAWSTMVNGVDVMQYYYRSREKKRPDSETRKYFLHQGITVERENTGRIEFAQGSTLHTLVKAVKDQGYMRYKREAYSDCVLDKRDLNFQEEQCDIDLHGISKFSGYDLHAFKRRNNQTVINYLIKQGIFFWHPKPMCRFAKSHGNGQGQNQVSSGGCEYFNTVVTQKKITERQEPNSGVVLCPYGILDTNSEYEVLSVPHCDSSNYCEFGIAKNGINGQQSWKYERIRIKKKPKTLRRYVMVSTNGVNRRIRCDDRYSIDLYTISQDVLDESDVSGNRFIIPKKYLGHSVVEKSEDPCNDINSDIVYYYENGGFVAGEKALEKCGSPVEEYYAPGKKVVGCEYDFIRSDNYKPFLQGSAHADSLSVVPLSKYEQGLCFDNFEKVWFRPLYYPIFQYTPGSALQTTVYYHGLCCEEHVRNKLGVAHHNREYMDLFSSGKRVMHKYRHSIEKNSTGEMCTLYRVEMWGGGEAAARTEVGGKRSGRPGQYVMLVLDLKKLGTHECNFGYQDTGSAGAYTVKCSGNDTSVDCVDPERNASSVQQWECLVARINRASKHSLVMDIGEGGVREDDGKGGDTVLKLCRDDEIVRGERTAAQLEWPYKKTENIEVSQVWKSGATEQRRPYKWPDSINCYEIARAVGGGSKEIQAPHYAMTQPLMAYYRTIYGDVLDGDESSMGLLENQDAMFTKFPIEMSQKRQANNHGGERDSILDVVGNTKYFQGRSLPKRLCKWKQSRHYYPKDWIVIPGMGGCWKNASLSDEQLKGANQDAPGVGENGAVMITCERWDTPGKTTQKTK